MKKDHLEGTKWSTHILPHALANNAHVDPTSAPHGMVAITSNQYEPIRVRVNGVVVDIDPATGRSLGHALLNAVATWYGLEVHA
ncbi:hypothetical protein [Arcanobacterium phocae]|uniref:hypothetical protein n=1 Tax=Arcanobacterium phocae TaxID=131112 RepID=UPI001C0F2D3B|nr:hypothetical protein [Arcanobacterium phocae]